MRAARSNPEPLSRPGPRLGAHLSIAGGLETSFDRALAVGAECLQIFVKNQRQWRAPPLTEEQIRRFRAAQRTSGVRPVIAHATYLLNLAATNPAIRQLSIDTMSLELQRCEALSLIGLVFHPGAYLDATLEGGISLIARGIDEVHARCPGFRAKLVLESTAGQGTAIGSRFEQLAAIIDQTCEPDRLGVCLDTCHLLVAGYDIRHADGYAAMMDELKRHLGLSTVKCIHMNDSKRELGSCVDRQEHIGKGCIGKEGFRLFVNDPGWRKVPMILETPKGVDGRGRDLDRMNLQRLKRLVART